MKKIFVSEPFLDKDDCKSILETIKNGFVSSVGNNINLFEKEIAKFTRSNYCVTCVNGTSALQVALKILGVQNGHEVVVPTTTFAATINAILYNNAIPVFMDCDNHLNLDVEKTLDFFQRETYTIRRKTYNKKSKKRISAIIVAHMYGKLCNVHKFKIFCKSRGIKILEDAAESFGSFFQKDKIHSGTVGDIGCFSFNGNKIITSGNGGAIISKNKKYIDEARYQINQSKSSGHEYIHKKIGFNFRMSNLNASLGLSQIKKLKKFLKIKKNIYNFYCEKLSENKNFKIIKNESFYISNNWINIIKINNKRISRSDLFSFFKKNHIELRPTWYPMNRQDYCKNYQAYNITNAITMHKNTICLPSSVNLKINDLKKIVKLLNNYEN